MGTGSAGVAIYAASGAPESFSTCNACTNTTARSERLSVNAFETCYARDAISETSGAPEALSTTSARVSGRGANGNTVRSFEASKAIGATVGSTKTVDAVSALAASEAVHVARSNRVKTRSTLDARVGGSIASKRTVGTLRTFSARGTDSGTTESIETLSANGASGGLSSTQVLRNTRALIAIRTSDALSGTREEVAVLSIIADNAVHRAGGSGSRTSRAD